MRKAIFPCVIMLLLGGVLALVNACDTPEDIPDTGPPPEDPGEDAGDSFAGLDAGADPFDGDAGNRAPFEPFEVSGIVVDNDFVPVAEAWVMQGGLPEGRVLTDSEGAFSFVLEDQGYGLAVLVATKPGYRAIGMEHFTPGEPVTLKIRELKGPDNEEYVFQDPGDGTDRDLEDCTHCHTTYVIEFLDSAHAESARSPLVQDLYAGVSRAHHEEVSCTSAGGIWRQGKEPGSADTPEMKCYLGGGVLGDLNSGCGGEGQSVCDDPALVGEGAPMAFGACADCHAPGIDGVLGGRNLHDAVGLSYNIGTHCDVCHKVQDIDLEKPPGVGQRLVMGRPSEPGRNTFLWDPVYYGPIIDVPNVAMGGSYQPKFKEATFCAGCHEQKQAALLPGESLDESKWPDGLPVHSTFSEWEDGPYKQDTTPCQYCHMPENFEMVNSEDLATFDNQSITFGFLRDPEDNRRHTFRGPLDGSPRLIDGALYASIKVEAADQKLDVTVSVANVGCGHAVPTGEPLRALVMVVEADAESCGELTPTEGMTIPDTGGMRASGIEGVDVTTSGTMMTWAAGAALAQAGQVIRVTRSTGLFDDYDGIGYFANSDLSAAQKGMEIFAPVGEAVVLSAAAGVITLDTEMVLQSGDRVYLGDAWPDTVVDEAASLHLAGKAGYAFSRVLVDSSGNRHVPHYRAVDMASDNRIGPGGRALTTHSFALPQGCDSGQVRAKVLYRPLPVEMAELRGWEAKDYIIVEAEAAF